MQSLTNPASISKRKQACKSCRQRKKRCDSARPTCGLCHKWNMRCEYTIPASLQAEQENMSFANYTGTLLGNMRQPVASFAIWDPTLPSQLPDFGLDAFSTAQQAGAPQTGFPTPISNIDPFSVSSGDDSVSALFPDTSFPSIDIIRELIDIFFDKIYYVLPCFHRVTFMEELNNGYIPTESPLLLYSMLAVAASFHHDPAIKVRRNDWYEQAKFLYDFTGRDPYPALRTIQAVVFLVYHAYTCGDFSACWLYIGKAWRQAAALGMNRMDSKCAVVIPLNLKDGADDGRRSYYDRKDWDGKTAIEREECRRVLWILFMMDRNQSWPTGWPNAIDERQFKLDIPLADSVFQAMTLETDTDAIQNIPFTRKLDKLLASTSQAQSPLNMFHYLIIAYILLGRAAELIHSIHVDPTDPEYAEECKELDTYVMKLKLSMPRAASSVLEAPLEDRGQVVWLNATLNTILLLLNYRSVPFSKPEIVKELFTKTVMAAKSTSHMIKDVSRTSIDLLLNVHIASSLYVACCVLVIHHRLEDDASLKNDIDFLELVFERMNDVFTVIGLKFMLALKRDRERTQEELLSLREKGYRGLLADCSKWSYVKDEVAKLGIAIS